MENKTIKHTLYTFGCSWTKGVGVGYDENAMWNPEQDSVPYKLTEHQYNAIKGGDYPNYEDFVKNRTDKSFFKNFVWRELLDNSKYEYDREIYEKIAWDKNITDKYSFRAILSQDFKIKNVNYSVGGSSNDEQFNHMYKIFGDPAKREKFLKGNPIVLWGITSTARIFRNNQSIMLREVLDNVTDDKDLYTSLYLKLYYDHDECVATLGNQIEFWNIIFEHYNIPVIWFDTFNTHKYPKPPRNFVQGGDLLTQMVNFNKPTINKIFSKVYHNSMWKVDDPRIEEGVKLKLLNPISFHPTKKGHEVIRDILSPYIKNIIQGA